MQLYTPDPAAYTILIWVCVIRKLCYCSRRSPTVISLLLTLLTHCFILWRGTVYYKSLLKSPEAGSALRLPVQPLPQFAQGVWCHSSAVFQCRGLDLSMGWGGRNALRLHLGIKGMVSDTSALSVPWSLGWGSSCVEWNFLSLTPLETETPLYIKGALVEGGAGLVSDKRMDSSSLHKSSLSIQSQNGRGHSKTSEYYSDSAVLFPALCDEGMCQSCHQVCLSNLSDFFLQCPQRVQRCGALLQWRDRQAWNLQRHQKRNAVSHPLQGKSDASRVASFSRDLVNFKPET